MFEGSATEAGGAPIRIGKSRDAARYGWRIDEAERSRLLELFTPVWPETIADHVTLSSRGNQSLPVCAAGEIVGSVDDGAGVQALIVSIEGSTMRPDGKTFHITWSIDRQQGRRPVDSNEVIARLGWEPLSVSVPITLVPVGPGNRDR